MVDRSVSIVWRIEINMGEGDRSADELIIGTGVADVDSAVSVAIARLTGAA